MTPLVAAQELSGLVSGVIASATRSVAFTIWVKSPRAAGIVTPSIPPLPPGPSKRTATQRQPRAFCSDSTEAPKFPIWRRIASNCRAVVGE